MPNKEALQKWVDRLEDPKSGQAAGCLFYRDGRACCLGHLAVTMGYGFNVMGDIPVTSRQVLALNGVTVENKDAGSTGTDFDGFLPEEMWKKLEIQEKQQLYSEMNDRDTFTLREIAAHIRKTYLTQE